MARPRKDPSLPPTDVRILDAAEMAFARAGYSGTPLDTIADAVGIRSPSLLYHFDTKAMLYSAVIHRMFDALQESLWEVLAQTGPYEQRVLHLMEAYLTFIEQRPHFASIALREIIDGQGPVQQILSDQLVPLLDQIVEWIETTGAGKRPPGVPVRGAVIQLCSDALLRAAAGPLQVPLWGPEPTTMTTCRKLLLPADPTH